MAKSLPGLGKPSQKLGGVQGLSRLNLRLPKRSGDVPEATTVLTGASSSPVGGSFTAPADGWYAVYALGHGGSGGVSAGTDASNGGGGSASRKYVYLYAGQAVDYTIPAANNFSPGNTVATLPNGSQLTAGPGGNGGGGFVPGGVGGVATGGDVNRKGGVGGGNSDPDGDPNTNDGTQTQTTGEGNTPGFTGAAFLDEGLTQRAGEGGSGGTGGDSSGILGGVGYVVFVGPKAF